MSEKLSGRTCKQCELLTIPGEPFACERCGALRVEHVDTECDSTGRVRAIAVVHRHARKEPATPFTVVEVELDAGPVIRTQLVGSHLELASIGSRVSGSLIEGRVAMMLESEKSQ
jgi:uncharacterized OB-fold protein